MKYEITHVYLARQPTLPLPAHQEQANYFGFWWKETALGHLFLTLGQTLSQEEYYSALPVVITPAMRQYASKKAINSAYLVPQLALQNYEEWSTWMASVFSAWLLTSSPPQVPVPVSVIIRPRNCASLLPPYLQMPQTLVSGAAFYYRNRNRTFKLLRG
jgi:hypothetical protein